LYVKTRRDNEVLIVCLYVDDLIYTGNCVVLLEEFKSIMINEFEMIDLGLMSYFLGMEVKQCDEGIYMSQRKYASDLLERLGMHDCNPMKTCK
jgi:transposase